ncbi:MAG: response regulator [Parvularcula sp.]|jgi:DNA-binding LytR/AlgR family response regulator|nr:response regulator [Parvularcula sp.]
MRAIIVEDEPVLMADLRRQLEAQGCEVVAEATSASIGRDLIRDHRPDIVFLDVCLDDGITGPSLADEGILGGAQVVFLTGRPDLVEEEVARQYPVLSKPIGESEVGLIIGAVKARLN